MFFDISRIFDLGSTGGTSPELGGTMYPPVPIVPTPLLGSIRGQLMRVLTSVAELAPPSAMTLTLVAVDTLAMHPAPPTTDR